MYALEPNASDHSPGLPFQVLGQVPGGLLRGRYQLIHELGAGAHGATYLAEHLFLGSRCAVKLLPAGMATSAHAVDRLREEARIGCRICDPHVVRVLDCDVVNGSWYFVMEYVPGVDLGHAVATCGCLPWPQVVQLAADAAAGLAAIHRAGVAHRDMKPANLLLGTDGGVRVADLGVAGVINSSGTGLLETPGLPGTLAYTAPEALTPEQPSGPAADLYSLGATLYHLLVGRPPHVTSSVFQTFLDVNCRPASWPADAPEVPEWLRALVLRLLALDPAERFSDAESLLAALREHIGGLHDLPRSAALERLVPRGVGVLAFRNAVADAGGEWLGTALAAHLARGLAQRPEIYVADSDALATIVARQGVDASTSPAEQILTASRIVGAGTVITGTFHRHDRQIELNVTMLRFGDAAPPATFRLKSPWRRLAALEAELLEAVLQRLGYSSTAVLRPRPIVLAARHKFVLGKEAYLRGAYETAIERASEAVAIEPTYVEAIGLKGVCLARLGRYAEAEVEHCRQVELAARMGDRRWHIEALANLGSMNYFAGNYERADEFLRQAATLAGELGLAVESAQISNNRGFVLFRLGRLAEAERAFARAIEIHRTYGGLTSLVGPYNGTGNVLCEQQRYEEAREHYRRALQLAAEVGDHTGVGTTHMHLGRVAALAGDFAQARHEFTLALNTLEETRFWNGLARAYEYIADMHVARGSYEDAVHCAEKRIELARQHANARAEAAAWRQKAAALRRAGRDAEAVRCEEQAQRVTAQRAA